MRQNEVSRGIDNDVHSGTTDIRRIIRDAWMPGILPVTERCVGWMPGSTTAAEAPPEPA